MNIHTSLLLFLLITGCSSEPKLDDLEQFIAEVKRHRPPPPPPLPKPKPLRSVAFEPGKRDPFMAVEKLPPVIGKGGIYPDFNRPKEPLEQFDLDALTFVGTVQRKGKIFALVQDPEGQVHTVQRGNYLGRHFGKIVAISEQEIRIKEIIPKAPGEWRERLVTLKLGRRL